LVKINDKPYEVFTGKAEDFLSTTICRVWLGNQKLRKKEERTRYDFEFDDKQGYRIIVPALSRSFEQEFWNYAKLISGVLRHGMPLTYVIELISNLTVPVR